MKIGLVPLHLYKTIWLFDGNVSLILYEHKKYTNIIFRNEKWKKLYYYVLYLNQ